MPLASRAIDYTNGAHTGDPAPETGEYELLNVFGSPTGKTKHLVEGEPLPRAPRSHTWRRIERDKH
jgi:hypothetical protein